MNLEEKKVIDEKFGYLFSELNQRSAYSQTFHYVFFLRRLILTVLIFSPIAPEFRLILSAILSITVTNIQMIFYLITSLCFKSKILNFLHISNEVLTFLVHFFIFNHLLKYRIGNIDLTKHCQILITISWSLNCLCSFSHLFFIALAKIKVILIKKGMVIKVADFGCARCVNST